MKNDLFAKIIFICLALGSFLPAVGSGTALLLGILFALSLENPFAKNLSVMVQKLLLVAISALGAGMNLKVIATLGMHGFCYTIVGIILTLSLGTLLGKFLHVGKNCSHLISIGTAICGGSAIAALSPIIKAKPQEISVALGTVFILNAAALFLFPWVGHHLLLSEAQFGLWAALAIHDTSSVVGATLSYGGHALEIGTTVKLARALWIMPICLSMAFYLNRKNEGSSKPAPIKFPWYILGFFSSAALVSWIPALSEAGHFVDQFGKKLMVLSLFLIGSSLNASVIKSVGIRPLLQGIFLWILVATGSLATIYFGLIS